MPDMKKQVINYEKTAGKEFGQVSGGIYYKNLEHICQPIVELFGSKKPGKKVKVAEFGSGSGIVGLTVMKRLIGEGFDVKLDLVDINQNQLDGAKYEAEKLDLSFEDVRLVEGNILEKPAKEKYDIVLMRLVLNYLDRNSNEVAIKNSSRALKEGGVFLECGNSPSNRTQQDLMSDYIFNPINIALNGPEATKKYYALLDEKLEWMGKYFSHVSVSSTYTIENSFENLRNRFKLSKEQMKEISRELLKLPEEELKQLNITTDKEKNIHYTLRFAAIVGFK